MRAAREWASGRHIHAVARRAFPRSHIHAPAAAPCDAAAPTLRSRNTDTQLVARRTGTPPRERGASPDVCEYARTRGWLSILSLSLSFPLSASRAPARGARGTLRSLLVARIGHCQSCQRATESEPRPYVRSKERTSRPIARIFLRAGLAYVHARRNESARREGERRFVSPCSPASRSARVVSSRACRGGARSKVRASALRRIPDSEKRPKRSRSNRIFLERRASFRCARSRPLASGYLLPACPRRPACA